jgi:glycosyltransferase involved in cell wall biosynthesis
MFVTPGDLDALTRALDVMATDEELRSTMGREALRRASELSWSRSAQVALDALEEAAAGRRRRATALQPRPI